MNSFLEEPRKTPKPTPVIQEIQSPTVPEVSLMFQNLRKDKSTPINVGKPVQSYNAWKLRTQLKNPQEFDSFLLTANKENTGILQNGFQDRSFLSKKQVRFQSPVQKTTTSNASKIEHLLPPFTAKVSENAAYLATMKQSETFGKINERITVNANSKSSKQANTSSALLSTKNTKETDCTDTIKNSETSNNLYSITKPFEQLYVSNLPIPNRELDLSFLEPQKNPCPRQEFLKKVYTASPDKNTHYSDYYKTIKPSFDQPNNIKVNQILEINQPQKEIVDFSNSSNTVATSNENIKNLDNTNNDEIVEESTNKDLASKDCDKLESDSPSVKDLLTIIKLQNQQLQKLQSQVEKLVQINEINQIETQATSVKPIITRNVILCKDQQVETSFQEQSIEQHYKHSNDIHDMNNKISVGLMTSFEVSFKPPPLKKNKKGRNLPPVQDIRYLESIKQACYPQPTQDRQYSQSSQDQQPILRYPPGQEVRYVQTAQQIQYSQPAQKARYPSAQEIRYQQSTQEKILSQPTQPIPYFQPIQKKIYPQQLQLDDFSEDFDERQYYQPLDTRPLFTEPILERPSSQSGQGRPYVQPPHDRLYAQPAQKRQFSQTTQERQCYQPAQEKRNQQCDKGIQYQQLNSDVIYAHSAPENVFPEQTKGIHRYEEDIQYQQQDQNPVQGMLYRPAKNIRFMQPSEPVHNPFMQRGKIQENVRIRPQNQKDIDEEINVQSEQQYSQVWNKRKPNETEYSLGSQESLEIQDPPESPENSIHIDMQEYDTESDDSDDECSTEPGWTFYKDILGQVNNILENSSKPSYKPNRNPNKRYTRNKSTDNTLEIIKNNAIQRLQNDGFLNTDNNGDIKPNEISFAVKQILMKYLPDQGLVDVANYQDERFNGNNRKPNDISVTTVKYMQQCNVVTNAPPIYDRPTQPEHTGRSKTKKYPQQKSKILDITTLKQQPKLL